jgi:hypothetical protein
MTEMTLDSTQRAEENLRVWWIPQLPMGNTFRVAVKDIEQALLIFQTLAWYDHFQLVNKIKGNYTHMGGLEVLEAGNWVEWADPETGKTINDIMNAD